MKRFLVLPFVFLLTACSLSYQLVEPTVTSDGYSQVIRKGITFKWKIDDSVLEVVLSAPTTGWVGVGLKSSSLMKDANIIIGYVTTNSNNMIYDCFGSEEDDFMEDTDDIGTADYTLLSASESNEVTTLNFTIPMDSGDPYDRIITNQLPIKCFIAYGADDELTNDYQLVSYFGVELYGTSAD